MPKSDPRGPKVRFHVWLYQSDIDALRDMYQGRTSVNAIVRILVSKTVANLKQKIQDQVLDAPGPQIDVDL